MNFADIQQQASRNWERFQSGETPRILVGAATCGRAAGAMDVIRAFREAQAADPALASVEIQEVGCLGMCYAEPLVEIRAPRGDRVLYESVTPAMVPDLIQEHLRQGHSVIKNALCRMPHGLQSEAQRESQGDYQDGDKGELQDDAPLFTDLPMIRHQLRVVVRNCGFIDPTDIDHYIARGGYSGIVRAMEMGPDAVIEDVKLSGLRGRGGAGFPTGLKWSFARKAPGDLKYVICNADEGDPGAFMDRFVLEGDPHAVLEGLLIAGYAVGASRGYVYCRAEYPLALERLRTAIDQMRDKGLLGENILGTGFAFDVTIKMGAGAFVCGEETSLMQSIEGKRGMPRSRQPFPANAGLFGKPTNINNVETLAAVSAILEKGGAWYAGIGTEKSMDEYLAHIRDHKCPAGACKALINFSIDPKACTGCMACAKVCPVEAVSGTKKQPHTIDPQTCIRCGACRQACKFSAVRVE